MVEMMLCWHADEDGDKMECWSCSMMVLVESKIKKEMSSRERAKEDEDGKATGNERGGIGFYLKAEDPRGDIR